MLVKLYYVFRVFFSLLIVKRKYLDLKKEKKRKEFHYALSAC